MNMRRFWVHANDLMDEPFEDDEGLCVEVLRTSDVVEIERLRGALLEIASGHPNPEERARRALREAVDD